MNVQLDHSESRLPLTTANELFCNTARRIENKGMETNDPMVSFTQGFTISSARSQKKTETEQMMTQLHENNDQNMRQAQKTLKTTDDVKNQSGREVEDESIPVERPNKSVFMGPAVSFRKIKKRPKGDDEPLSPNEPISLRDLVKRVSKENIESLLVKQESLKDLPQVCLVCFEKTADAVFMNCGHGGICYDCSLDVLKKSGECHLCREVTPSNESPFE